MTPLKDELENIHNYKNPLDRSDNTVYIPIIDNTQTGDTDMTKYTKRAYLADIATNEAEAATVQITLAQFAARLEDGETLTTEWSEAWNAAHDREWELSEERADIERRWNRRHWTGADHATAELVAANID